MKLEGETPTQALNSLLRLRVYAPYRFGGKWYMVETVSGTYEAYRTRCKSVRRAKRIWLLH